MGDAAASSKRPVEDGAQRERQEPPSKSIKFAADTKPSVSSVGFNLPASHVTSGASAPGDATPAVHANQKVGEPVDLDGGYRCTKTGRWIGNGTWVRPPLFTSYRTSPSRLAVRDVTVCGPRARGLRRNRCGTASTLGAGRAATGTASQTTSRRRTDSRSRKGQRPSVLPTRPQLGRSEVSSDGVNSGASFSFSETSSHFVACVCKTRLCPGCLWGAFVHRLPDAELAVRRSRSRRSRSMSAVVELDAVSISRCVASASSHLVTPGDEC